ncbi:MAG: mechanosensitive ion channel, partial [Acidobacteria bacterium]|nr:mechanosensitive ion channel [Acidobacteriota bacterium]
IQIGEHKGDVIDIRAFRFTLFEIAGERVDAEQPTGRLLHVPNGLVFTEPLANFTEGFQYVWHEIPVLVTFESNWETAQQILPKRSRSCHLTSRIPGPWMSCARRWSNTRSATCRSNRGCF